MTTAVLLQGWSLDFEGWRERRHLQLANLLPYSSGLWVSMGWGVPQLEVQTKQLLGSGHLRIWLGSFMGSIRDRGRREKEALQQTFYCRGGPLGLEKWRER